MLSRVADAVYWMSRYVERSENVARFVDVNLSLAMDLPEADEQWLALVKASGDEELFARRYGDPSRSNVIQFLTFEREAPNSILSTLSRARENARTVREVISSEMWEQINKSYLAVRDAARSKTALDTPHDFFTSIKQASQLFVGMTYLTMTHNEAWHFARVGRLLERADKTSRFLDVKHFMDPESIGRESAEGEIQWSALLRSASAFEMYRKRFGQIAPLRVIEFLLFSQRFPRSVRYCLRKAERSVHAISGTPLGTAQSPAERVLGRLAAQVEFGELAEVMDPGLHEWLDAFQTKLNRAGDAISETFFRVQVEEPPPRRAPRGQDRSPSQSVQGQSQSQSQSGQRQSQSSSSSPETGTRDDG